MSGTEAGVEVAGPVTSFPWVMGVRSGSLESVVDDLGGVLVSVDEVSWDSSMSRLIRSCWPRGEAGACGLVLAGVGPAASRSSSDRLSEKVAELLADLVGEGEGREGAGSCRGGGAAW